jgi:predicted RNA methylase
MDLFNNLQVYSECLLDVRRTSLFDRAIREVVTKDSVVLDAGTGSGILALLSARAGAKKVFAVDIAEDAAMNARKNLEANGFGDISKVFCADLKTFDAVQGVDVLTMEMMDTGLVSEQQAVAINVLRKNGVIDDHTVLLPYMVDCVLEAVSYDFNFYGFTMPFLIQARNYGANAHVLNSLSKNALYRNIDFRSKIDTKVDTTVQIPVTANGYVNAFQLKTKTYLSPNVTCWATTDMNMPVVIPVEKRRVHKGGAMNVHIKYEMGEGFKTFDLDIV